MAPQHSPAPGRLLFVNRFYAPDLSATAQILTDVAEALSAEHHRVVVFASRLSYDGKTSYARRETIKGVEVHRVWSSRMGRDSTIGRAIDYLTFYLSISFSLLFVASKRDLIIAKTDPPMLSIPLGFVARLKRSKLVNWLQDIFPEVAQKLGYGSSNGAIMRVLTQLRNRSLQRAGMNVVIGTRMAEIVHSHQVPRDRVHIIENFVDDTLITPAETHAIKLREDWGLKSSDFIVGYSGNLGRAHDLDTMLDAAEQLKDRTDIKFLFIGGGYLHNRLKYEIETRQLPNIRLKPYQPRSRLVESLALPNLHWASLVADLEGHIVPSKIYGVAAAGRPLLMIGDPNGEIGRIFSHFPFGICIPQGESTTVRDFILKAQQDVALLQSMGHQARAFTDRRSSRRTAVSRWDKLLRGLYPKP